MKKMIYGILAFIVIIGLWSLWGFLGSNVEQADYTVVQQMDGYEIREYPEHIVAQATVQGGLNNGFSIVAGYIFGGNTKKESISMTAPVIAQKKNTSEKIAMTAPVVVTSENISMTSPVVVTKEGDTQTISFGMPRGYTRETLPTPNDPRVKIVTIPTKRYAVMKFSGYRSDKKIKRIQEKLLSTLAKEGIMTQGNLAYAGYNAPWTPPRMTRNEVLVEIQETMTKKVVLAGGCFWGMEKMMREQPGVINTTVGYAGGQGKNPTYQDHKGYAEAVEIEYDPAQTSYQQLLDFFFQIHNPTTADRQCNDIGSSYRSAIFYGNEEEKQEAKKFIKRVNDSKRWKDPVVTTLETGGNFYPAEEEHQDYLQKNPDGYSCHTIYFDSYIR